jgi:predicted CXXCH cytochrome family protein
MMGIKGIPFKKPGLVWASALALLLTLVLLLALPGKVAASPAPIQPAPVNAVNSPGPLQDDNDACLTCHSIPGQATTLDSGDNLSISIDKDGYYASLHGSIGMTCVTCHPEITSKPHPGETAKDLHSTIKTLRDYAQLMAPTCQNCHKDKYDKTADSAHNRAMQAGNQNAPVCSDCHNPHLQGRLVNNGILRPEARVQIPLTCARCHNTIYQEYKDSVHGAALIGEGNPDVPTCTNCHGVHNIGDPLTVAFRLSSPQMCAKCHTDAKLMGKYNLSTQVLNTYVADFHGTTVVLFQKQSPDQQTNKPVCFDCHGVHNISKVDDPNKGLAIKTNLLGTCKKCHPDASTNFPTSWLSHYIPSPSKSPLVYYVQLFYTILIPLLIGGMLIYVITDVIRRQIDRRKGAALHE